MYDSAIGALVCVFTIISVCAFTRMMMRDHVIGTIKCITTGIGLRARMHNAMHGLGLGAIGFIATLKIICTIACVMIRTIMQEAQSYA